MLSSQPLFSKGVESLLRGKTGVEIVGRGNNAAKALERIRKLKPNVVVIDSKDLASAPFIPVARLLQGEDGIKIISMNLENQTIRVYRREQRTAQGVEDLLEAIAEDEPESGAMDAQGWLTLASNRSQVYGFLAATFNGKAGERLGENFVPTSFMASLGPEEDLTGDLREGIDALEQYQLSVANKSCAEIRAELAEEYSRLIRCGNSGKAGRACESAFVRSGLLHIRKNGADVTKAYAESGLRLPAEFQEHPDFIGCELVFMQALCSKECAAWETNDRAMALKYQGIEQSFIRQHLVRWVPRFCDVLLDEARLDFYQGIALLTKGFVLSEAYRIGELMDWECAAKGAQQSKRY